MSKPQHLLEIHAAVLLFGLAGLFGKWISLPAVIIVLGRVIFAALSLAVMIRGVGAPVRLNRPGHYWSLGLLGVLLAAHWITFFQSIQISTVAVGLLTFSTFPIFTALLEPLFEAKPVSARRSPESEGGPAEAAGRHRWRLRDLLLALATFFGVALVVPGFRLSDNTTQGALWGVASGATFAVLSILNRRLVQQYPSLVIAFYQDSTAALVLLPFLFILQPVIGWQDLSLMVLLGVVFTAISHTLFINGMRTVPARTASIIASLEPVYGIAAAAVLLGEPLTGRVLTGGAVILVATGYASLRK